MKWFHYISVCFLCSLVIYTGAGVALMQFCCQGCRDMQEDHSLFCQMRHPALAESSCCAATQTETACCCSAPTCEAEVPDAGKEGETCTVEIYKPDWLKQVFSPEIVLPVCDLWLTLSASFLPVADICPDQTLSVFTHAPPIPGREYLTLYSTFLI
ncbi:MAG: hypothetical protein LUF85_05915 [Bacteroides sp.]|nr:hypothetical protein [Bacteroides sp.]